MRTLVSLIIVALPANTLLAQNNCAPPRKPIIVESSYYNPYIKLPAWQGGLVPRVGEYQTPDPRPRPRVGESVSYERPPLIVERREPIREKYNPPPKDTYYTRLDKDDKDEKIRSLEGMLSEYKTKVAELQLQASQRKSNELDALRAELEYLRKTVKELKKQ